MISVLLSRLVLLVFGTLYPAYASYKTVKTKNVREYVKWMMYWIVFALYTFVEIFTDIFVAFWFPFYYEFKVLFVLWLMCPATRGSSYIFKMIINPQLSKHEEKIDSCIRSVWDQGYDIARKIGAQGLDYLIEIILELLRKGQIRAISFLPKMTEIAQNAQNATVIDSSIVKAFDSRPSDENSIDEDEFDMLLMESQQFYNEQDPQSSDGANSSSLHLRSCENNDSDSGSESNKELPSVKRRPLRITSKSKDKATVVKVKKQTRKK